MSLSVFASDAANAQHAGSAGAIIIAEQLERHGQTMTAFMRAGGWA